MSLTEIEWETVEKNLSMLSDETLQRFSKRIAAIQKLRQIQIQVSEEAFE